jgi:hypothetical protein
MKLSAKEREEADGNRQRDEDCEIAPHPDLSTPAKPPRLRASADTHSPPALPIICGNLSVFK